MRLKSMDGPLSVHNNCNPDLLNSPKRLNTLQNSNITTNNHNNRSNATLSTTTETANKTETTRTEDYIIGNESLTDNETLTLNNINTTKEWFAADNAPKSVSLNNTKNNLLNINNTLALKTQRIETASSVSSPDDSFVEYAASSEDISPEEERHFVSDSDSEEGNLNLGRRGIVNPNYPGFQHLAHTLDFVIKSDSEDECDSTVKFGDNNDNNNNNNNEDEELQNDKIDSVNRLDSVENIQKVFYDKPVVLISAEDNATNQQQQQQQLSQEEESNQNIVGENIVGDFGEDLEREFGRIKRDHLISIERAVEKELEEACEKLAVADLQPTAAKYNIEPNVEQPFQLLSLLKPKDDVLDEANTVPVKEKLEMSVEMAQIIQNYNPETGSDIKCKLADAFLSSVQQENLPNPSQAKNNDNKISLEKEVKENWKVEIKENLKMEIKENSKENNEDYNKTKSGSKEDIIKMEVEEEKKADLKVIAPFEGRNKQGEMWEKFCKEEKTKEDKEKDEDSAVPRKKEKMESTYVKKRRDYQIASLITRRELTNRNRDSLNRRSMPIGAAREKSKKSSELLGGFDVYNIETAMPKIDLEAIESHLRAARAEERRRRTDREEIRRRLAMGHDDDYYNGCDRPGRKPSLQARLQSGMNLQICFMNETVSDTESPSSDSECTLAKPKQSKLLTADEKSKSSLAPIRPATLSIGQQPQSLPATMNETDFFTKQARLQTEARMALAQAKEMARMQMEIERQRQKKSPITEMVRHSMEKVGIPFPEDRRRLSRQILTEMNVAQLQVIVNDLHSQIEILNEQLVKFLMNRDDLHMEQDSMLVDIEDLTRFLGAKEQTLKDHTFSAISGSNLRSATPTPASPSAAMNSVKPHLHRIASFVKK